MGDNPELEITFLRSLHAAQLRKLNDSLDILHGIELKISTLGNTAAALELEQDVVKSLKTAVLQFEV